VFALSLQARYSAESCAKHKHEITVIKIATTRDHLNALLSLPPRASQIISIRAKYKAAGLKVGSTEDSYWGETIRAGSSLSYRVAKDRLKMSFEYWYATSSEGRVIRYGYKELSDGIAAISATVEGRSLMILQRSLRAPLTRAQVEALFQQKSEVTNLTSEEYRSSAASGC